MQVWTGNLPGGWCKCVPKHERRVSPAKEQLMPELNAMAETKPPVCEACTSVLTKLPAGEVNVAPASVWKGWGREQLQE